MAPPPIGFISFNLDCNSSAKMVFEFLDFPTHLFQPRRMPYSDDVAGVAFELHCEYTAELLGISECNDQHAMKSHHPDPPASEWRRIPARRNEIGYP